MTYQELKERQAWSLEQKIDHSLGTINQFYERLNGQVYVSFSGGKDSTVLLWLARKLYPDIKAVYCNTGNEYPDIVKFVRDMKQRGENIEIIYPKLKPREVLATYGFPLISKEMSEKIWYAKNRPDSVRAKYALGAKPNAYFKIANRYMYLLNEPYKVHSLCCQKLKKDPFHRYERENKLYPIMGTMASESKLRESKYLSNGGCNIFHEKQGGKSMPLSIWTEQDIWDCINRYNIPIAEIYRKGAKRTGCMFCGYGIQFKDDERLKLVHDLYPKWYHTFMNYTNNGVSYREAARKVLSTNGLFLPDEAPPTLFDEIDLQD